MERTLLAALCSLVALAAPLGAQQVSPELEAARAKLSSPQEGACNEGVDVCVRANSVAAVEVLLEVLCVMEDLAGRLPQAHYRDVVWGGLVRITDPYARRRVALEIEQTKLTWVRQWCVEAVGEYGQLELGEFVLKALRDRDLGVQRAAARALGKMHVASAVKALQPKVSDADELLRANAVEALCRIEPAANEALLLKALKDKDAGVRCALLGTAAECYPARAEEWSAAALKDADWRPRMQAVDNLGAIRTKGAIDALVLALSDGRPAVAARAVAKLQALTGQLHRTKESWSAWWTANRDSFAFPEGATDKPKASGEVTIAYHGIEVRSDHAVFLIDRSAEMRRTLKSQPLTKEEAALAELEAVLTKLEGKLVFNVLTYAEEIAPLFDKEAQELTARNRLRALDFVRKSESGKAKDIWKLLQTVLADPDIDTAFLLSSGEPDIGTYVHWNRVCWHLADLNRFRKLVVHTIAYSDSDWYRSQLQKIAETTGGEFRSFE